MTRDRKHQSPQGRRLSRREFVKQSAGVAGALSLTAPLVSAAGTSIGSSRSPQGSANDSVGVGFIGIGIRGEILVRATQKIPNTRIVEICDLYTGHFDRAKEVLGPDIKVGRDYKRLLDNKDIQAVVIAVPDHHHKRFALEAMAAGKDVYVEKPMTHKWEDAAAFEEAAAKQQRILQVGSQYQSMPANERAIEIIKSGKLGQITLIDGAIHRNTGTGAWYYPVPPDASPETIDWERFLGDAPKVPFDAKRFFQWRLFWDYSGGLPTDLFVHLVTATHSLMGVDMPSRVIGVGGIYRWKPREVPDQLSAIVEYPEGFTLRLSSTANNNHAFPILRIMGTEGALDYYGTRLVLHSEPQLENYTYSTNHFSAAMKKKFAELNDLDPATMRPRKTSGMKAPEPQTIDTPGQESTEAHLAKFYDSVRTRKQPVEDAKMGGRCATVGHMVNLSYLAGKEARWDKQKQAVRV